MLLLFAFCRTTKARASKANMVEQQQCSGASTSKAEQQQCSGANTSKHLREVSLDAYAFQPGDISNLIAIFPCIAGCGAAPSMKPRAAGSQQQSSALLAA